MDDGMCRSTCDIQLIDCISDTYPSVLLNQNIKSFSIQVKFFWVVTLLIEAALALL
jgi:hypothetical protein